MKPAILFAALAGLAGGVVGATFVQAIRPAARDGAAVAGAEKELAEQGDRLRALQDGMEDLAARLETVENAPPVPREPPAGALRSEPVLERAAANGDSIPPPEELRNAVATILREERDAERKRADERREQQRLEQMERRLDRLGERVSLSAPQKDAMRKVLLEDEERRRDFVDRAARGEVEWGDPAAREEIRVYTETRQQKVQGILTPEQFEQYQSSPEGRLAGFFTGEGGFGRVFGDRPGRNRRGGDGDGAPPAPGDAPR